MREMMRVSMIAALSFVTILTLTVPTVILADPDLENMLFGSDKPVVKEKAPGIMWHIQAGVFVRAGGQRYRLESSPFMVTVDLSWLRWDGRNPTWGLGIHSAFSDDGGPRFGPKAFYRKPLTKPGSFFQASAGVFVSAMDKEMHNEFQGPSRLTLPGYFLEAEYGITHSTSLVTGVEALPLDIFSAGVYDTESATAIDQTTITNFWMGFKGGQKLGMGLMVVAGAVVGLWAASYTL